MLKLVKTELTAMTETRLTRVMLDVKHLQKTPHTELRAAYTTLEAIRDSLSEMLDRMDGKHV
jgi:hypothetical protein